MPDFVPVKALKKEPLRASCAIDCAQHCPMDILLEELHEMGDVDVLVVGGGTSGSTAALAAKTDSALRIGALSSRPSLRWRSI